MRARWAEITNERLKEQQLDARIDHRSLKEQGIDREPTVHLGPSVMGMERRGIRTEVGERVREEQRREMELRLEKAAEFGKLERESQELQKSILDLSGDVSKALEERDQANEVMSEARAEGRDALDAFRRQLADESGILKDLPVERARELERDRAKELEREPKKQRNRGLERDGPDFGE